MKIVWPTKKLGGEENFNERTSNHLELLKNLTKEFDDQNIFYSVLGGFAVDGQLGKITREHEDLDIAIFETDKEKLIKLFQEKFSDYRLFKNYPHKVSFSKHGMLVDFLLLRNENSKIKLSFSWDKNIPLQDKSAFIERGNINNFVFNTVKRNFLISLLERFYQHRKKTKN